MTKEEYRERTIALLKALSVAEKELADQYIAENNPHKVGDIIKDVLGSIRIEEINTMYDKYTFPYCHYYGTILTDKLVAVKGNKKRSIFQKNIE